MGNLIMAIFIDNVTCKNVQRKQAELGESSARIRNKIIDTIGRLVKHQLENDRKGVKQRVTETVRQSAYAQRLTQKNASDDAMESKMLTELEEDELVITRDVFNTWLKDPDFEAMLEEADIETSTKFELFDVLDVDMGGELEIDELIGGLMSLRGPISKSDMMAVRLQVKHVTKLMEDVWNKVGCDQEGSNGSF